MKKCPICGERFADTYKRCPFCEEEENPRRVRQPKRYTGGGRRLQHREYEEEVPRPLYEEDGEYRPRRSAVREEEEPYDDEPPRRRSRRDEDDYDDYDDYYDEGGGSPWFKIVMIVLIAIIVACLLYLGRGAIGNLIGGQTNGDPTPPSSMNSGDEGPDGPNGVDPVDPVVDPNGGTEPSVDDPGGDGQTPDNNGTEPPAPSTPDGSGTTSTRPDTPSSSSGLTLSHVDVSIDGGETFTLSARSGSGDVTYASKNTAIATVDSSGKVTGVAKGATTVTVTRGAEKAECIVRVRNNGAQGAEGDAQAAPSGGNYKLNRDDFTLAAGETFDLKLQGVTTELSWSIADTSVATVDGSGKVTGVAKGVTKVTAFWDGGKAECIVRVK